MSQDKVVFGVYFDGTNNNKFRDNGEPDDANGPTNVAKLFDLAVEVGNSKALYIPGVGTSLTAKYAGNDTPSQGFLDKLGLVGGWGVEERLDLVLDRIDVLIADNPGQQIELDITGFSRGAAEGIALANRIHQKYGNRIAGL